MKLPKQSHVLLVLFATLVIAVLFAVNGLPYGKYSWSGIVSAQGGEPPYGPGGGCEVTIPAGSVVGQFVGDTRVYWAPNLGSASRYVIDDQDDKIKTAWVIGQDESETFYKIVWACQLVWVLKESMGPNPDGVWQNTPLPTRIVE